MTNKYYCLRKIIVALRCDAITKQYWVPKVGHAKHAETPNIDCDRPWVFTRFERETMVQGTCLQISHLFVSLHLNLFLGHQFGPFLRLENGGDGEILFKFGWSMAWLLKLLFAFSVVLRLD